jgi:uncharacterized membrane protein
MEFLNLLLLAVVTFFVWKKPEKQNLVSKLILASLLLMVLTVLNNIIGNLAMPFSNW